MSNTQTLERARHETGLSDSTHSSSSSSAERYRLDEFDGSPILLYKYRGGLQTSSQKDLCCWLDKGKLGLAMGKDESLAKGHPSDIYLNTSCNSRADRSFADDKYRVTRKPIPRLTSYINIKRHDLYLPSERELYADFPNYNSDLASIKIPSLAYWSRLFMGNYQDLYIVSPESSPSSSQADDESRRTSPTTTWGADSLDAKLGAVRERQEVEEEEEKRKSYEDAKG